MQGRLFVTEVSGRYVDCLYKEIFQCGCEHVCEHRFKEETEMRKSRLSKPLDMAAWGMKRIKEKHCFVNEFKLQAGLIYWLRSIVL